MTESTPGQKAEQARPRVSLADVLTAIRLPLAVIFLVVSDTGWRLAILVVVALSDLLDGIVARRYGGTRFGAVLDPVADKLFMLSAFIVVGISSKLQLYEIAAVLLRDLVASVAFVATLLSRRPRAIPARLGGKAVTVAQLLTLLAFVTDSPLLRPLAWATGGIGLYAIWDYYRVAPVAGRRV